MEIIYPYCEHKQYFESETMGDGDEQEETCDSCKKTFDVVCTISVDYDAYPKEDDENPPLTQQDVASNGNPKCDPTTRQS